MSSSHTGILIHSHIQQAGARNDAVLLRKSCKGLQKASGAASQPHAGTALPRASPPRGCSRWSPARSRLPGSLSWLLGAPVSPQYLPGVLMLGRGVAGPQVGACLKREGPTAELCEHCSRFIQPQRLRALFYCTRQLLFSGWVPILLSTTVVLGELCSLVQRGTALSCPGRLLPALALPPGGPLAPLWRLLLE